MKRFIDIYGSLGRGFKMWKRYAAHGVCTGCISAPLFGTS
jgi:hypothetical protein